MYDANPTRNAIFASPTHTFRRLGPLTAGILLVAFCAGCAAPLQADQTTMALDTPDAAFELWEQHWTLNPVGYFPSLNEWLSCFGVIFMGMAAFWIVLRWLPPRSGVSEKEAE